MLLSKSKTLGAILAELRKQTALLQEVCDRARREDARKIHRAAPLRLSLGSDASNATLATMNDSSASPTDRVKAAESTPGAAAIHAAWIRHQEPDTTAAVIAALRKASAAHPLQPL